MSSRAIGLAGEDAAAAYVTEHGLKILARSVRLRRGELDLIAVDGDTLVFIEVKSRRSRTHGTPVEAIGPEKQHRLGRLALAWLANHSRWQDKPVRFDVIALTGRPGAWDIVHIKDAFQPG